MDCNDVTGQCVCKTTWNGTNCAVDVDECDIGTHDCNSILEICQNRDNGWHCNCRYGSSNGVCNGINVLSFLLNKIGFNLVQICILPIECEAEFLCEVNM